jgi:ribosomal protein L37AE/L43A
MNMLDMLIELRGGLPEKCDFCDQPYNDTRHPEPEEAGAWACTECVERWRKEDRPPSTGTTDSAS